MKIREKDLPGAVIERDRVVLKVAVLMTFSISSTRVLTVTYLVHVVDIGLRFCQSPSAHWPWFPSLPICSPEECRSAHGYRRLLAIGSSWRIPNGIGGSRK